MDERKTRNKRKTFRMTEDEYETLKSNANECGMDISSYLRTCLDGKIKRVLYDPSMMAEVRAYRQDIRDLAKNLDSIFKRVDHDNYIQTEDIKHACDVLKSIYHKMSDLEHSLDLYREELINGNYKAS